MRLWVAPPPPPQNRGPISPVCPDFVPRFVGFFAVLILDSTQSPRVVLLVWRGCFYLHGLSYFCGCKRSSLQAVTHLAPFVQAQVAQRHSQLPTDANLCSLCIRSCPPCPFFVAKPAATTVTSATSSTSSMTAAASSSTVSAAAATDAATTSGSVSAATATTATAMTPAIATTTTTATTSVTATTFGAVKKPQTTCTTAKRRTQKSIKMYYR